MGSTARPHSGHVCSGLGLVLLENPSETLLEYLQMGTLPLQAAQDTAVNGGLQEDLPLGKSLRSRALRRRQAARPPGKDIGGSMVSQPLKARGAGTYLSRVPNAARPQL